MNSIIDHLRARKRKKTRNSKEKQDSDEQNKIIGGIGTIEGRIWIVFNDKRMFSKAIIKSEQDFNIFAATDALRNLERGPTGNHDIFIRKSGSVELLYCHRSVSKVSKGGNVTLCGRTFIVYGNGEQDDEDLEEYELERDEHLEVSAGNINVRVCAAGHKIYIDIEDSTVIWSQLKNER